MQATLLFFEDTESYRDISDWNLVPGNEMDVVIINGVTYEYISTDFVIEDCGCCKAIIHICPMEDDE